jgi:hypothetical protein
MKSFFSGSHWVLWRSTKASTAAQTGQYQFAYTNPVFVDRRGR